MTQIQGFGGVVIAPGTTDYDTAIVTHRARRAAPALIVRPVTTADVSAAIAYAAAEQLPLAVRSGGHTDYASVDGSLVLDLAEFHDIEVLHDGLVRIGAGARWGEVAAALAPHGLALSSGDATTVGVGGLTLSGGIGWLVRQVGLTIDSLVSAEVVLASGEVVTASAGSEPELFWAIRGGGGNFGVVTRFTFQAHPFGRVIAGWVSLDATDLKTALAGWRDVMRGAPENLNSTLTVRPAFGPDVPPSITVTLCYPGTDRAAADAAIQPLLDLPTALDSDIAEKDYADMLSDEHLPEGLTILDNNGFVEHVTDELIDALVVLNRAAESSVLMVRWIAGALNRVPADETAFAHRAAEALVVAAVVFPPGASTEGQQEIIAERWAKLAGFTLGMYGNFTMDERAGAAEAIYPAEVLARLRSIKGEVDPHNVFALNHNITPA
ncbi:FAD-binding oxidoreductase [Herbiconiux daphne]|uniref:FAD-binding oxidoreductase n=1 Tax=Herbiconiux daphne TaxID=2970914 RepID=A0ABT2H3M9_9MICO|nr:FAD-binding oxidoreductase [Herbiconiux daphne]MCS5734537.1 FAD-binding oxidoreductase [Herbiconiux daphne]